MASIDFVRDKYVALGKERLAPPVVLEENPVVEEVVAVDPKAYAQNVEELGPVATIEGPWPK